ncbi:NADH-dependent dehydrogenase [Planctomycetales bacterium 10988]|nr:NADH-dependent dehydrogenase [Planctomycetales bacterium 10988]
MAITRRDFLKTTAVTTAALSFPLASARAYGANDTIRVAVIGLNGRGKTHMSRFAGGHGSKIVALCDCDEAVLGKQSDSFEKKNYKVDRVQDYRKLLDRDDIDVISIATPNHTHSLLAIQAAEAGKDVYLEKPVSHNVWEGRQAVNASEKYGRLIQTGTQARSYPGVKAAVEYVQSGKLGKIKKVVGICYKPRKSIGKLSQPLDIPQSINYDLWCGPAAMVDLYRPKLHYDWHWDFNTGNGDMGNQGIHQMDVARWFLGEDALSSRVLSIGGRVGYEDAGDTPNTQVVYHEFATAPLIFETRGLPESKEAQARWKPMDDYKGLTIGVVVHCENGYATAEHNGKGAVYTNDGEEIESWREGEQHFENFLDAVRAGDRSLLHADIKEGHLSSALCHTGNISHRVGQQATEEEIHSMASSQGEALSESVESLMAHLERNQIKVNEGIVLGPWLEMDPQTERFTNSDQANKLLRRDGRKPFMVPDLSPQKSAALSTDQA